MQICSSRDRGAAQISNCCHYEYEKVFFVCYFIMKGRKRQSKKRVNKRPKRRTYSKRKGGQGTPASVLKANKEAQQRLEAKKKEEEKKAKVIQSHNYSSTYYEAPQPSPIINFNGVTDRIYTGELNAKGEPYGKGIMNYEETNANGYKEYNGEWLNGFKQGNGIMNYANGDIYNGHWTFDIRGPGVIFKTDRSKKCIRKMGGSEEDCPL